MHVYLFMAMIPNGTIAIALRILGNDVIFDLIVSELCNDQGLMPTFSVVIIIKRREVQMKLVFFGIIGASVKNDL
jgi:hypothetical protein